MVGIFRLTCGAKCAFDAGRSGFDKCGFLDCIDESWRSAKPFLLNLEALASNAVSARYMSLNRSVWDLQAARWVSLREGEIRLVGLFRFTYRADCAFDARRTRKVSERFGRVS